LYTYCANNPLIYFDPSGHFWKELWEGTKEVVKNVGKFAWSALKNTGKELSDNSSGFAVAGSMAAADGPAPVGDTAGLITALTVLTVSAVKGVYDTAKTFEWTDYSSQTKSVPKEEEAEKDITIPKLPDIPNVYYHYTNEENAMEILKSGKILPDEKGRVFLTPYLYSPDEVNNALFMGMKSEDYGEYRITVQLYPGSEYNINYINPTQPNEIIYYGTIRNGRNATLTVVKNE